MGAISILIVEKSGVISAETGIVPDTIYQSHVMPLLLQTFNITNKISSFLGKEKPDSVWYFSGEKYDLFWSHIDVDYGMMVITSPVTQNNDLTWVLTTLDLAIQEVTQIILDLSDTPDAKNLAPAKTAITSKDQQDEQTQNEKTVKATKTAKAELPAKNKEGSNGSTKTKSKEIPKKDPDKNLDKASVGENSDESEVHEFWKAATLENEIQRIDSPNSLSFEQAQKLGFIPGGENNGS